MHRSFPIALMCVAFARSAAQRSAATQRDSSRVAAPDSSIRARRLQPVRVEATILPVSMSSVVSGVPARISTLSGTEANEWHPRVLPDVLGKEAGVSFYDDLGTPWKLNLSTRGFTAGPTVGLPPGITVFLDGVRQNEADAQEINFDLLPLENVERIEFLSGTASLLGPNSLGGAVNLITARGDGPLSGTLSTTVGSFGNRLSSGSFSGRTAANWDYLASAELGSEGGWREATSDHKYDFFANVGRERGDKGLRIQALASRSRAETAGSLPESIYWSSPRTNFTPGDFEDLDAQQISVAAHADGAHSHGALNVFFRHFAGDRFNVNQAPDPNVQGLTNTRSFGAAGDWRWSRTTGRGELGVRLGFDASANRVRVRIFNDAQESVVGAAEGTTDSGLTTDVRSPNWNLAAYVIGDYRLGRVTASGGMRADRLHIPFRNLLDDKDDGTSNYSRISPRAGVSVDLGHGALSYASVSNGFRAPAILELGCADPQAACPLPFALGDDPPLKPVRSTTYEVGTRWTNRSLSIKASAYRIDVDDEIFFVASPTALLSGYFTNLDRTRRTGLEVGIEGGSFISRLSWYANYAYTRAAFESPARLFSIRSDDDFDDSPLAGPNDVSAGDRIPLVPAHQAKAGASLSLGHGIGAGLDARYIGQQWLRGDESNETSPLAAYTTLNGRVGVDAGEWRTSLVVTNMFDSHRATFGTFNENRRTGDLERFLTPLTGRAFSIEVRRTFSSR